jgi:DNA-binding response OmpR family regulator
MVDSTARVLIVDDERQICELVKVFLSRRGFEVETALSGAEALEKFDDFLPQAVLLDIRMPELSGIEVLRRIKDKVPKTKVIILSAFGDSQTVQKSLALGASGYIQKPIELELLLDAIETWPVGSATGDDHAGI